MQKDACEHWRLSCWTEKMPPDAIANCDSGTLARGFINGNLSLKRLKDKTAISGRAIVYRIDLRR